MTQKENYFKALKGEVPEWVPVYWDACQWFAPACMAPPVITGKPTDVYGVSWEVNENGAIPTPNKFILSDVTKWRDSINLPKFEDYDWEAAAKTEIAALDPDKAVALHIHSVFTIIVNAMGFEEALIAMYTEPESVLELFNEISSFQEMVIEKSLTYYPVDVYNITDDVAHDMDLFVSPDIYRKLIAPFHRRQIELACKLKPGIFIEMHCCGKCDQLIEDWLDMGVTIWQPAQIMNDLQNVRNKYGSKFVINGAFDNQTINSPNSNEEIVRQAVRDAIDSFAPNGGYVFWDSGPVGSNQEVMQRVEWAQDEARKYGADFYK